MNSSTDVVLVNPLPPVRLCSSFFLAWRLAMAADAPNGPNFLLLLWLEDPHFALSSTIVANSLDQGIHTPSSSMSGSGRTPRSSHYRQNPLLHTIPHRRPLPRANRSSRPGSYCSPQHLHFAPKLVEIRGQKLAPASVCRCAPASSRDGRVGRLGCQAGLGPISRCGRGHIDPRVVVTSLVNPISSILNLV